MTCEHLLRYETKNKPTTNTDKFTYHNPLLQNTAGINGIFEPNKPTPPQTFKSEKKKPKHDRSDWVTKKKNTKLHFIIIIEDI
jgi:hypothetical protein